jgi:cyanophycinase
MKNRSWLQIVLVIGCCFFFSFCKHDTKEGKLFIIGGGQMPPAMIDKIIELSGIGNGGYGVILPMASVEPDTAIVYTRIDLVSRGPANIYGIKIIKGQPVTQACLDSIRNARLIFISGGDQARFMDAIAGTPVQKTIHEAFENGSLIAGTSAGAAVMSRKMITGNELKYPGDTGDFKTMEEKNIEVTVGLGMLRTVIIDQHFIKRKRLNRLISVCMENPENMCVGIDESTAILVEGNKATVYGISQVVVLHPASSAAKIEKGKLGVRNIKLDVYLPGESFRIIN